ncbi:Serine/threonine protein kinase [Chitinophaga costaii]|uniref:Serine/threonine protein kinase n=1 Tax=Chitinophaga costaii TaxID=1335309 RepID=A0A1C4DEX5_9BACT|nr:lanthionine synthetase LanC family protein [Chitinophaga costaii]SCC29760.1 Serine/threonine protein kinase [Chitinophaga costaii]
MEAYLTRTGNPFLDLLHTHALVAEQIDPYFIVGDLPARGWVLHISVVTADAYELLAAVLPFLKEAGVAFAMPVEPLQVMNMCSGLYGNANIGKVISIYPVEDAQALALAEQLVAMTKGVGGPRVPTGIYLGGTVYASTERLVAADASNPVKDTGHPSLLPDGVTWPFASLASPIRPKRPRKLKGKYVAFDVLKQDPKGSVIKAIRRRHVLDFKWVIVKMGNKHMCSDSAKQDIRTRLRWQQTIAGRVGKHMHTPAVYEYFEIDDDGYLVMEYIKGTPLRQFVLDFYKRNIWLQLPTPVHTSLIDKLIEIVGIARALHALGLVHRDLTTMNFMMKKGQLYLLDMELVYSLTDNYPMPVFGVGSKGYMSPEQEARAVPTVKEDIFAIGGIMQKFFTGLDSYRLWTPDKVALQQRMYFFLQDEEMAALVAACLQVDPLQRPTLDTIEAGLQQFKTRLLQKTYSNPGSKADVSTIRTTIQAAITGLSGVLTNNGYWASKSQEQAVLNPNEQSDYLLYGGLHHGAMGVLYLLSRVQEMGFDISPCKEVMQTSWALISEHYLQQADRQAPGLGDGMAGIAVALLVTAKAGLLPPGWDAPALMLACFQTVAAGLELMKGLSGLGLGVALLAPAQPKLLVLIPEILGPILNQQTTAGNWLFPNAVAGDRPMSYPGLMNGNAGITYFLLLYWEATHDAAVELPIRNALRYQRNDFKMKQGKLISHEDPPLTLFYGISGVALTFIKAFEIFKDPADRKMAEDLLGFMPEKVLVDNLTTSYGITGIGEVYLEAYRIFGDEQWLNRADYIAQALLHMTKTSDDGGKYWLTDPSLEQYPVPDLMIGNAGIVHFLLRYLEPAKYGFPMLSI